MQRGEQTTPERIRSAVAERYSLIGSAPSDEETIPSGRAWALRLGYSAELLDRVPAPALQAFTGIGTPLLEADLVAGEQVLDLGCGAGMDSLLAAQLVGPDGFVYGVDLAPGMVTAARRAVAAAGLQNIDICEGAAEHIPLPNSSIDVALVNGLFNLAPEKSTVASELARVVRPGGRLVGAEIVITDDRSAGALDEEAWFT